MLLFIALGGFYRIVTSFTGLVGKQCLLCHPKLERFLFPVAAAKNNFWERQPGKGVRLGPGLIKHEHVAYYLYIHIYSCSYSYLCLYLYE